jgi:hypothetical protein
MQEKWEAPRKDYFLLASRSFAGLLRSTRNLALFFALCLGIKGLITGAIAGGATEAIIEILRGLWVGLFIGATLGLVAGILAWVIVVIVLEIYWLVTAKQAGEPQEQDMTRL